ncbi:unnamed protein product [Cyclocybe aegerita]|uniref:Uncharacterized protein n=1 Tax=Cyclocybe aegerita TaxID=1973307 RepID=A0A8S0XZN3_CYCAE|nr:unnamed protein product [Cyclocybe aegerita]
MGVRTQLEDILARKDDETLLLESRVQAYIARTSLLQTRLLSTLDTLDAQQAAHARELAALARDRERLKAKVHRYAEVVRIKEEERDDMRDAVLKLIEKVEISNDYNKWPHSQIYISSLADVPLKPRPLLAHRPVAPPDAEDLLQYTATMLEAVRRERDSEKHAHERTREVLEAHILTLEAKLSRRDAELESCVASAGHGASLRAASPTLNSAHPERRADDRHDSWSQERREISSEEMIGMLDVTAARNKVLEAEIKILARRLHQARATAATFTPSTTTSDSAFPIASGLPRASGLSSSVPLPASRSQRHRRPRNHQLPSNRHPSSFRDDNDVLTTNPTPQELEHPFKILERQIQDLSTKIDGFAEERRMTLGELGLNAGFLPQASGENSWTETPAIEGQVELTNEPLQQTETPERPPGRRDMRRMEEPRPPDNDRNYDDVLHARLRQLEEECERLRSSEARLQDHLHFLQIAAQRREDELEAEVDVLRRALELQIPVNERVGAGSEVGQEIPAQLTLPSLSTPSPTLQPRPPSSDLPLTQLNQTGHVRGSTQIHRQSLPSSGPSSSVPPSPAPTISPHLTVGAPPDPIQPRQGSNQRDNLARTAAGSYLSPQSAAFAFPEDHQRLLYNHQDEHPLPGESDRPPVDASWNEAVMADMQADRALEPPANLGANDLHPASNLVRRRFYAQDLLDDQLSDGEISMELATPLLPVSVISISDHQPPPLVPQIADSSQALSLAPGTGGAERPLSTLSPPLPIDSVDVDDRHGIVEVDDRIADEIDEENDDHGIELDIRTDYEHDRVDLQPSPNPSLSTSGSSPYSVTASMPLDDPFIVPRSMPGSMLTSTPLHPSHRTYHRSHYSHHHSNPFDIHADHEHLDDADGPPGYEYEHSFDDTHHSFDLRSDEGSPTLSQMVLSVAASASSSAGPSSGARSGTHSGTNLPDSMRSPAHSLGVLHPAQTSAVNTRARVNAEDLTSELEKVEGELSSTQTELEMGEDVLAHLEDLVRELRMGEREEAEDEGQARPP